MRSKIAVDKILVTGGAGFIGSHLVDALLEKGLLVTVIDNLRNGSLNNIEKAMKNKNFTFFKGDILSYKDCLKVTEAIDCVFHLACLGVRHSIHSPLENHRVNAEGTINMLNASLKNSVKKFYYISSSEVYGDITSFPIKETNVPVPKTVYGSSKLAGENYCYSYFKCYDLDTTILRFFNNYGPRAHYEGDSGEIIPRSIMAILNNRSPVLFGDGNATRDFFYVEDTVEVMIKLLGFPELKGKILNIGTGVEISMKKLLETILKLMGKENKIDIKYLENRPADVPRLWVDNSRFNSLVNYSPKVSFEKGLLITIDYYKKLIKKKNTVVNIPEKNWEK